MAEFINRSVIHCYTQNMKGLGHVVSEKNIFSCFPIVSLCELMTPGVVRFLTPGGGLIRRINVKLHIAILHTKYRRFGPCGFR